jgi:lantibiotic transport system permease protein
MSLLISLESESVKIKRSAAFYICFIVAAIIPLILFFDLLTPSDGAKAVTEQIPFVKYFQMAQQIFNFIFMPLFIILISTLLLQIEYRNNTWKQVLTSPQKLFNVFLAKFLTLHLLIILFITTFIVLLLIGALLINLIHPGLFKGELNLGLVLRTNWNAYLSIFAISAIQFWLALRFKNFIAPLAIGFCLWFMAPLMLFSLHWSFADRYPYSFPILLAKMSEMKTEPDVPLLQMLSVGYALFFLALAFIEFKIRRVKTGS